MQLPISEECVFCYGVADFIWLEDNGQFRVCVECIKDGETDAVAIDVE